MKKQEIDTSHKIITFLSYLVYISYLFLLIYKWDLASGGNYFVGSVQAVVPLSALIFINLVLKGKVKIVVPM